MTRGAFSFLKAAFAEVFGRPREDAWDERSYGDNPHLPPCALTPWGATVAGDGFGHPGDPLNITNERT